MMMVMISFLEGLFENFSIIEHDKACGYKIMFKSIKRKTERDRDVESARASEKDRQSERARERDRV